MKKITVLKGILDAKEMLSNDEMTFVKGGTGSAQNDDKRRQRPGGGVSTL